MPGEEENKFFPSWKRSGLEMNYRRTEEFNL